MTEILEDVESKLEKEERYFEAFSEQNRLLEEDLLVYSEFKNGDVLTESTDTVVKLNTDTEHLYVGSLDGGLIQWNVPQNRRVQRIPLLDKRFDKSSLMCMDIVDGIFAACGTSSGRTIMVDLRNGERLSTFEDHTLKVSALSLPSTSLLYSVGYDGIFRAKDLNSNTIVHHFCSNTIPISTLSNLSSNDEVVIGNVEGNLRVLDLRQRNVSLEFNVDSFKSPIRCLEVNSNDTNQLVISYGNGNFMSKDIRKIEKPVFQHLFTHNKDSINSISIDDKNIYTGGDDGKIFIWDCKSGVFQEKLESFENPIYSLKSKNGYLFVGGLGTNILRYEIASMFDLNVVIKSKQEAERIAKEVKPVIIEKEEGKTKKDTGKKGDKKKGKKEETKKKKSKK